MGVIDYHLQANGDLQCQIIKNGIQESWFKKIDRVRGIKLAKLVVQCLRKG